MNAIPRKGDFIQTYSGRQFWPVDPRPEDIDIQDIAHALAFQCRYAGHCKRHYSVAEHSVLVAHWIFLRTQSKQWALTGLLHDAQEAYVVDVPRPLKPYLVGYKDLEAGVWQAVATRFGLDVELPDIVKEADNRILTDERAQNMNPGDYEGGWPNLPALGVTLPLCPPEIAETWFLQTFATYS